MHFCLAFGKARQCMHADKESALCTSKRPREMQGVRRGRWRPNLAHTIQKAGVGNGVISSVLQAAVHHLQGSEQLIMDEVCSRVILQNLLYIHAACQDQLIKCLSRLSNQVIKAS